MTSILAALIVLGIIIVIHELGHFLVAKFFKIRVETFSVGFGPRLVGFRYGETDYRISIFPLGGYVKMSGENPTDSVTGAPHEFLSKPKWQRFLVAAAGPAMNVLLAVGLLTGLYMYGTEVSEFLERDAIVGNIEPGSAAAAAGIQPGDRIIAIDGKDEPKWEEVESRIMTNAGHPVAVKVSRQGKEVETVLTPVKQGPSDAGYAGMQPQLRQTSQIERVSPGSPAEAAGLMPGDKLLSVNGVALMGSGQTAREVIQTVTDKPFPVQFERSGEVRDIELSTISQDGRRIIGVDFVVPTIIIKEGFRAALSRSIDKNIEYGTLIFQVLRKLVTRQASMKSVDGPIGIVRVTGQFYKLGIAPLLMLMAMISLNLGLMNLLPIPILDGGVMMLLLVESVMGRDLSMALKERIVQVSFVFLLTLMVFVLYNDVLKLLPTGQPAP